MNTILSTHQSQILETLLPVAEIATNNTENNNSPLKPRMHTLICAPSGTGKSYIMRELGNMIKTKVLILNVSSWMPLGSSIEKLTTFDTIIKFIDENPKGIIVLDELDKIDGTNDWAGYVRLEIHDLLDGIIPESALIPGDDEPY